MLFEYIPPSNLSYQLDRKKTAAKAVDEEKKVTKSDVMDALKYYDPRNELESHFRFKNTDAILELYSVYKRIQKNTINQRLISLLGFRVLSLFRYLDHVIKPEENKDIQRTRGVLKAFVFFKGLLEKIRKRKEMGYIEAEKLCIASEEEDEAQEVPLEEKRSIIKTRLASFSPDFVSNFRNNSTLNIPVLKIECSYQVGIEDNPFKLALSNEKHSDDSFLEDKNISHVD